MSHAPRIVWPVEYAADHAELNRQRERNRREFRFQSPQFQHRSYLVSWVRARSESLKFCTCTVHLAIYILDIFMDNYDIDLERLHLVALTCLQVASKFEECDKQIPKAVELNSIVNNRYTVADFHYLEVMMLSFLDWNLNIPTAAHFAEYYSLFAVTRTDWNPVEYVSYETFWQEAQRAVKDYLELSLLDSNIIEFLPSMVACASILLARQQLRLVSKWTDELQIVTKYSCHDLTLCVNAILRSPHCAMDRKRKLAASPDIGYGTGGSTTSTPDGPSSKRVMFSGRLNHAP